MAAARRAAERRRDQAVRRKAREQTKREREQARRARAAEDKRSSRRHRLRSPYGAFLDEQDARVPLTRADLHSQADELAAAAVAAGGGIQAVIEVTDLHTRANVDRLIDPVILTHALDNAPALEAGAASAAVKSLAPASLPARARGAGAGRRQIGA